MELGYSLPDKLLRNYRIKGLRVYVTGTNLFSISKFKLWDVEMAGNGLLGYPVQRTYNMGLYVTF